MKKSRIAAIDIGTNSIRCIIAEASHEGKFKIVDDEKATVRLGEKLAMTVIISEEAAACYGECNIVCSGVSALGNRQRIIRNVQAEASFTWWR